MAGPQHPPPSLSPTRIKTYQRCPLAYRYRYIDMVAAPPSPASLLGHCLHAAIEANFRAKRRTRRDSSEAELGQVFDREWDAGLPPAGELVRGTPEEFAEVREEGYQLIRFYIDNVASAIRPHLVEHRFRFRIDGLPAEVVGQVDLIESDGTVVDHKSSVHPYSEDYLDNDVQLLCYSIGYGVFREGVRLRPGALPPASRLTRARVDVLIRGPEPVLQQLGKRYDEADVERILGRLRSAGQGIASEDFRPFWELEDRKEPWRTCAGCEYFDACEARVEELG